jgi:tetratricopeptide (TPR) repeat protein
LDIRKRTIELMEHDNQVPESISRRRAIALLLGIPPVLLGLSFQQVSSHSVPAAPQLDLGNYNEILRLYWDLDYSSSAAERLADIQRWIRHLSAVAKEISDASVLSDIYALRARYHQLACWIFRDQREYAPALKHANAALKIARHLDDPELIAASLFRRGRTYLEQGILNQAIADLNDALPFAQRARPQLRALVLLAAGHARAHLAPSSQERSQAIQLLDSAGRIIRRGDLAEDESFVKLNPGRYHIDRAGAMIELQRYEDALDELELAEKGIGPDQPRRLTYINIMRATAYARQGEMMSAISLAEDALATSRALRSAINIARIAEIQHFLEQGKFGSAPQIRRLRLALDAKKQR